MKKDFDEWNKVKKSLDIKKHQYFLRKGRYGGVPSEQT
jgi:hypothetical protein